MAAEVSLLRGSCACERNRYEIEIPMSSVSLASVFFDNSAQSRRPQATPVTAWLRIPLDFFHSATYAQFPDETHTTIRRTYSTSISSNNNTRRQFCGYCGSHISRYNESQTSKEELIDITLGSLLDESLDQLQQLSILPDVESSVEDKNGDDLVRGGSIDNDTHITTTAATGDTSARSQTDVGQYMQHRGMPYFEEMIENSPLGRVRRQKGGHRTDDGKTTVHWEIVEYDGDDEKMEDVTTLAENAAKRLKRG